MAILGEALRRVGFLAAPSLAVLVAIVAMTGPLGAHRHDRKGRDASQAISGRHAAIWAALRGRGGGIRLGRRPCRKAMEPP